MDERETPLDPSAGLHETAGPAEPAPVRGPAEAPVVVGYGVGVGLVFVATLGVFWNYWRPETSALVWTSGSFAVGAVIGAAWAAWRRMRA